MHNDPAMPFRQWQDSIQIKAVLPLAKRLRHIRYALVTHVPDLLVFITDKHGSNMNIW